MLQRNSFPQIKFIIFSLILFLLFIATLFFLPLAFGKNTTNRAATDTFYLNQNYSDADPLLTTVPDLSQIIAGPIITDVDPQAGPTEAKVNLVVYTDFTCYYCGQTIANALKLQTEFPTQVRVVHKDFPNADTTYKSYQAAIAGRCAQAQDKFWDISDLLYKNYNNLSQTLLSALVKQLKLDPVSWQQCLTSPNTAGLINDDINEANALQISGVPTVYVNNQEVMGEPSYEEMRQMVEEELTQ